MVSVLASAVALPVERGRSKANGLGNLREAVEPFTQLILRSGCNPVRLQCTVPTCASSETCPDLHDLDELRSRFLLFLHTVLEAVRLSGISASYSLTPSNACHCMVRVIPSNLNCSTMNYAANDLIDSSEPSKRESVVFANFKSGPALIIT